MSKAAEIRKNIVGLSHHAKSAHLGSSLSCVEILESAYLARKNVAGLKDLEMIMSKGHAAMALYATAIAFGELDAGVIEKYLKDGSSLWGHPSVDEKFPFISWSTGSLGHGLPVAVGKAYARLKLSGDARRTVVVLSDGELDEGSNWEALLVAAHHGLKNLLVIVDYNKIQSFGFTKAVLDLEPLKSKFDAFGWDTLEVDGHKIEELSAVYDSFLSASKPTIVLAHTVKGKGIPEIENTLESHYKPATENAYKGFWK